MHSQTNIKSTFMFDSYNNMSIL